MHFRCYVLFFKIRYNMSGIARYSNTPGPFPSGFSPSPWSTGKYIDSAFLMTGTSPASQQISGLALCNDTSGVEVLLASQASMSMLHTIDPDTMAVVSSAKVANAGAMVCGPPGMYTPLFCECVAS